MHLSEPHGVRTFPITSMKRVPIGAAFLAIMTRILTAHGATLAETPEPPPAGMEDDVKMYTLTFPPGTRRSDELMMRRSQPFVILFPDGYQLHGAELWPISSSSSDRCINGFALSPEQLAEGNASLP
jgi:hypothetical protein